VSYLAWIGAATINATIWLHVLIVLDAVSPKLERAALVFAVVTLTQIVAWKAWHGRWSF
jgi:hypothetical protein